VPVPFGAVAAVKVTAVCDPSWKIIVWLLVGPVPEKVARACAAVASVVRLSVLLVTPFKIVIVGAVAEVGEPATVPIALPVVPPLLKVTVFAPL
jgi:hypothetical protein